MKIITILLIFFLSFAVHSFPLPKENKATYDDMKKLIDFVRNSVREKTGINLDLEIEIVE